VKLSLGAYRDSDLPIMCRLYHTQAAALPHVAPLEPDDFHRHIAAKQYFDPEGVLVARNGGNVLGWIHACVAPGSEPWHRPEDVAARIRMLVCPPDRLDIAAALIEGAHQYLRATGHSKIEAFHARAGYPFYRGLWMGGEPMAPVTLPHLLMALSVAGYKATQESVFLTRGPADPPPPRPIESQLAFEDRPSTMVHDAMRASWDGFDPWTTTVRLDSQHAGAVHWVVVPQLAEKLGAPCMNIWGLGVEEKYRGRGIASALIGRALRLGRQRGATHASVGTQLWNMPAHATYVHMGYRPQCVLHGLEIDLDAKQ
jgi:GNAT superfamily N-acetyltransferase